MEHYLLVKVGLAGELKQAFFRFKTLLLLFWGLLSLPNPIPPYRPYGGTDFDPWDLIRYWQLAHNRAR